MDKYPFKGAIKGNKSLLDVYLLEKAADSKLESDNIISSGWLIVKKQLGAGLAAIGRVLSSLLTEEEERDDGSFEWLAVSREEREWKFLIILYAPLKTWSHIYQNK